MRKIIVPLLLSALLLVLICVSQTCGQNTASGLVGVKVGDWVRYDISLKDM